MSGHSKWATIHRAKGIKDSKKGAAFTKLGKNIAVAVRAGGGIGDPNMNFKLRLAIDKARQFNMPKENIMRAIEKGMGKGEGEQLTEVMFEGFAPGGVAVLVGALTDNKLRTAQEVRDILDKGGGVMGSSGSVSYMFTQEGEVIAKLRDTTRKSQEEQELELIDLGLEDIAVEGGQLVIYCDKDKTHEIAKQMEKMGYEIVSAELTMKPAMIVEVTDEETTGKVEGILERLEDLDDVDKVWSNYG